MELWDSDETYQRIGDVIVKFSPFFKMYTEYVKNFDNGIHTINTTYAKNTKFAAIMDLIHVSDFLNFLNKEKPVLDSLLQSTNPVNRCQTLPNLAKPCKTLPTCYTYLN